MSDKTTNGMTDADLISYCESHCTTERALFNADQVNRMIELAGNPPEFCRVRGWVSAHEEMAELCKLARARLVTPLAMNAASPTDAEKFQAIRANFDAAMKDPVQRVLLETVGWLPPSRQGQGSATSGEAAANFDDWYTSISVEGDIRHNMRRAWIAALAAKAEQANTSVPRVGGHDDVEKLRDDLAWHKESLKRHSEKLAAVWGCLAKMISEHTGKPCSSEPFEDLAKVFSTPVAERAAAPASASINEMRIALNVQLDSLIDLGDRYARRMRSLDPDESAYAQGAIDHARKVASPYRYNGPYRAAPASVPEGYKLAPAEPTDRMTYIGQSMRYESTNSIGAIYRAMISAAPEVAQPAAQGESVDTPEFSALAARYATTKAGKDYMAMVAHVHEWGASQRQEGRRDMHETSMSVLAENCALVEKLRVLESLGDAALSTLLADMLTVDAARKYFAGERVALTPADIREIFDAGRFAATPAPTAGEPSARTDELCNSALRAEPAGQHGADLVRAAEYLEHYAKYLYDVKLEDIERHPYIPSIEEAAYELRAMVAKGGVELATRSRAEGGMHEAAPTYEAQFNSGGQPTAWFPLTRGVRCRGRCMEGWQ